MRNSLLSLLQLSDPGLPIGGYAHSNGLETYVQQGLVNNLETASAYIYQMLSQNLQFTDAALVSLAFDAACHNDFERLVQLDEECTAVKLPFEVRTGSKKLGTRLIKIFELNTEEAIAKKYARAVRENKIDGHYCIAFGLFGSALKIKKEDLLTGFYHNAASGHITNCVKLIPLGQKDGQKILFGMQPFIEELVNKTMEPDLLKLGICCTGFDIRCMQHEQLYSRLYMS